MGDKTKGVKNAVALVIYHEDGQRFLIVKRPPDDDRLPNIWGLPAGSLKEKEDYEDAVKRVAKEKLGVEVVIKKEIGEGEIDRSEYILYMKDYEVKVVNGNPQVPQSVEGVTQYVEWKWGEPRDLLEAAQKGSLCSQLYLSSIKQSW